MLTVAVNNTAKRQELDFKQRVLSKMKLQIKKKLGNESKFFKLSKANSPMEFGNR